MKSLISDDLSAIVLLRLTHYENENLLVDIGLQEGKMGQIEKLRNRNTERHTNKQTYSQAFIEKKTNKQTRR